MKIKNSILSFVACAAVITLVGCKKTEPTAPDATTNSATVADAPKDMSGKTADMAKDMTGQAVSTATNAMAAATGPFNDGMVAAKKFVADKDYQGALGELAKLSNLQLTEEQTKMLNDLKAEVQSLMSKNAAGGAADAAKNMFGK